MKHSEIRHIFYDYFSKRSHHKVLSAPLPPAKDPTLLFTNAGMNQFKSVFLQEEKREYDKAVSIQKCMRVSGKHNDFDEVGKTDFHHTFFEMMGNFSFGDYFKEKAIEYGWELLTEGYGFKPEDLWVTVYKDDDEAFKIWEEKIGIPSRKIIRLGEKDNFWQMGDTGPCGPCSEIHFDRGAAFGPDAFSEDNRRYMEIWNLVFMQYFKDKSGALNPLPAPSIDTGMGMERLTAMLQGKTSNYDTDLFRPIIQFTAELSDTDPDAPEHQVALKVVADHVRALSFLISDGVLPANDGRGYVLRRVLRRAAKHGKSLGFKDTFLHKISGEAIELMKDHYPELEYNRDFIAEVILAEENRFNQTLVNGLKRFEDLLAQSLESETKTIPGGELFKLSDTYGFPLDFAVDLANEKDAAVDYDGYREALEGQKEKSRLNLARKQKTVKTLDNIHELESRFTGYDSLEEEATVLAIYVDEKPAETVEKNGEALSEALVVLDKTPCYAESGGQIGDTGLGKNENVFFKITDTRKAESGAYLHAIRMKKGKLAVGDIVNIAVDRKRRADIEAHHSTTHLLHAALREVLGLHVKQAGSYVGPDKLRFDFTHFKALTPEEIAGVETIVNEKIRENLSIETHTLNYEDAIAQGAMAIFEEKYADVVRMLAMGDFSKELCGGAHLRFTGEAGTFMIVNESSISSGIRRIEAVAGEAGYRHVRDSLDSYHKIQAHFRQKEDRLLDYLVQLEKSVKEKERLLKKQQEADARPNLEQLTSAAQTIGGVKTVVAHMEGLDRKQLSTLADDIQNKTGGVVVLSANIKGKSAIIVSLAKELTQRLNANVLIKEISKMVNGSGGGRPDFAQAGGAPVEDAIKFKQHSTDIITGYLA